MPARRRKPPNIVLFGIESLRADHLSCYGYGRLTTPHIDRFAQGGTLFERYYSPHIPTTSGYANMLTGMDVFSTQVVALRHQGPLRPQVRTLPEMLRDAGYTSTCIGFSGNPSSRGFDTYLDYAGWGSWNAGRSPKAQNLNRVAIPELERLVKQGQPFLLFMRHMDPHSPYLAPEPYERMFYHGHECNPRNKSMEPVMAFKPFRDYFATWMPPGLTDKEYVIAQYDGELAYMDACIQTIFTALEALVSLDRTIVVVTADHGETLYDHDCYFDHHGLYEPTLHVPLVIRYPARVPAGQRVGGYCQQYDLTPTILELAGIEPQRPSAPSAYPPALPSPPSPPSLPSLPSPPSLPFDGRSLMDMVRGEVGSHRSELYITECTWMRKHGWRTPQWKLIEALEPDFHFKPPVELYNLVEDPAEYHNLAESEPEVVALLKERMEQWIARREQETGLPNPIHTQGAWYEGQGPFTTSQEAYDTLHIGDPTQAARLQAGEEK